MQNLQKLMGGKTNSPYQTPLKVKVAAVAATHRYQRDGREKTVTELAVVDPTAAMKAVTYDENTLNILQPDAVILLRNIIYEGGQGGSQ